jgi:hypothetical protein
MISERIILKAQGWYTRRQVAVPVVLLLFVTKKMVLGFEEPSFVWDGGRKTLHFFTWHHDERI